MNVNDVKVVAQISKRMLCDSIWKSTLIEGYHTTYLTTEKILNNISTDAKRDEVLFVVNMNRAWNFVYDTLGYPVDLSLLRQLNKICGDSGLIYSSGDLRKVEVRIGASSYIPPIPQYEDVVNELSLLNAEENPVIKSLALFCYIAKSQLFIDGNKRLSQLIMNKVLIENGIGYFSIPEDKLDMFKVYLLDYYEDRGVSKLMDLLKSSIIFV